ncbi:hypothetical protein E2C01_017708 [Portunus trituberculatus]|uniref:Uncharacterized protein n=1 Tax=Portunus trituberculatus TaxID=210409 RepID=A0A5B7DSQ1_PORTR|nr:hypothetical protein [Portunus trituberculatus]
MKHIDGEGGFVPSEVVSVLGGAATVLRGSPGPPGGCRVRGRRQQVSQARAMAWRVDRGGVSCSCWRDEGGPMIVLFCRSANPLSVRLFRIKLCQEYQVEHQVWFCDAATK